MNKLTKYLTGKNLYSTFLHVALVVLAVEVVILAKQNREFKRVRTPTLLKVGDYFSMEKLEPINVGHRIDINSRKLVFIFTTTCPRCEEIQEKWRQIIKMANQENISMVGISLDSKENTIAFADENDLEIPIFYPHDVKGFRERNKIVGVPATLILDPKGKVEYIRLGPLDENEAAKVVAAIHK